MTARTRWRCRHCRKNPYTEEQRHDLAPDTTDTSTSAVLTEIHKQLGNTERSRHVVTLTRGQTQALLAERDAMIAELAALRELLHAKDQTDAVTKLRALVAHWRFVYLTFAMAKISTSERLLQDLDLPDDEAHADLSWHIDRAIARGHILRPDRYAQRGFPSP